ncbi:Copper type II ascorbate-dependent monooxygenase C-terminal [Trinorchestia longiramus]|nr:Copper type II ascorbate-dependent monooxygenase C-terminal [Trinorchestia longiramus]
MRSSLGYPAYHKRDLLYCDYSPEPRYSDKPVPNAGKTEVTVGEDSLKRFPLLMPHVTPKRDDTYFCTPIRIDPSKDYYITGFQPNTTSALAHHMLLVGCEKPGLDEEVWNCGGMAMSNVGLKTAPTCAGGNQIIYAWALDAPTLLLPEGVAFKVGKTSDIKYLVLQVHYASKEPFQDGTTDDSGIFVYYKETPQPRAAGVLLLGTGGRILPKSVEYMESACAIHEDKIIHPFAFRTHTHSLGRVVSGYKVTRRGNEDEWTLLGKKDPQLPQMFYPIATNTTIRKGDRVAARCTMVSDRETVTRIGSTGKDEMCNFYMMYYTDVEPLVQKLCFSLGPPFYSWSRNDLRNIPDADASSLPVGETAQELGVPVHHIDTKKDEMCNFYLLYWTNDDNPLEMKTCFSAGSPREDWTDHFNTIPKYASKLDAADILARMRGIGHHGHQGGGHGE